MFNIKQEKRIIYFSSLFVFLLFWYFFSCDNNKKMLGDINFSSIYSYKATIPLNPFTPSKNKGNNAKIYVSKNKRFGLDAQGILTMDYGNAYKSAGIKHNPTFIATYASALYKDYLDTSDITFKKGLTTQVDWLLKNKTILPYEGDEFWVWPFDFDLENYRINAPWWSGLSQGRIMTAVLAAYQVTKNPKYIGAITPIYRAFLIPTKDGGLATYTPQGVWYEEYTNKEAKSAKILNGHISALAALWTLWHISKSEAVKNSLELGIDAVVNNLDKFDSGATGILSLNPHNNTHYIGRLGYNTFHIYQLLWLYKIRPDSKILTHALNFSRYDYPGYTFSVLGSTDPVRHGPENLNYEGYPKHWAHNQFPTWAEVDMGFVDVIQKIMIVAHSQKSAPRDFILQSSIDGQEWIYIGNFSNNTEKTFQVEFLPVSARYVRIVIKSDNGNYNTCLNGIIIWQKNGTFSAISNFQNFSSGNSPQRMFGRRWKADRPGWFILDLVNPKDNQVRLQIENYDNMGIHFFESNDLSKFSPVKSAMKNSTGNACIFNIFTDNRYLKCKFNKGGVIFSLKKIRAGKFRTWVAPKKKGKSVCLE